MATSHEGAVDRTKWNRNASTYDLFEWPMEHLMLSRWRRRLVSLVIGPRVLEVGVATGKNLSYYPAGLQVDGVDFSPRMLERARRRGVRADVELHEMDIQEMTFPSGTFDNVVSVCVFCSVPDPVAGLREVRRVLREAGHTIAAAAARILATVRRLDRPLQANAGRR